MDDPSSNAPNKSARRVVADTVPVMSLRYYKVLKRIDSGCSGDVYVAKNQVTSGLVAVKVVPKGGKSLGTLNEQKALVCASGSPLLLEIEASFHDKHNFYIITARYFMFFICRLSLT